MARVAVSLHTVGNAGKLRWLAVKGTRHPQPPSTSGRMNRLGDSLGMRIAIVAPGSGICDDSRISAYQRRAGSIPVSAV